MGRDQPFVPADSARFSPGRQLPPLGGLTLGPVRQRLGGALHPAASRRGAPVCAAMQGPVKASVTQGDPGVRAQASDRSIHLLFSASPDTLSLAAAQLGFSILHDPTAPLRSGDLPRDGGDRESEDAGIEHPVL